MVFNGTENESSLTTIILSTLVPLARWATIEMLSNSPPTFPIASGEWATAKGTPCHMLPHWLHLPLYLYLGIRRNHEGSL